METLVEQNPRQFVDRRSSDSNERPLGVPERRQFRSSQTSGRPEVDELAQAVDQYKLTRRRRFITYEELYNVIAELGYHKD
ncbi:MAG: hypothetical protein B7Z55_16795 [Planctomycetales bacterium 12-60-4]|nr:MAG: hypothetical protein B7Z55_16795 [Planctomycetales bacterium 12-60-4]